MSAASPLQIDFFRKSGYVVVPGLLGEDELARFGTAVDDAVARRSAGDPRPLEERTRYEQSFRQCLNLWEDSPDVRALTFHPELAQIAAALLGAAAVRVWHDQALYKEGGGRPTAGHYDQAYWPIAERRSVTAWIPFGGSTVESGAMGYVPGSQRFDVDHFPNIFTADGFDLEQGAEAQGTPIDWVEVPAGAVAFHHGRTLHCAKPNQSAETRRVHTVIYFADGCTRGAVPPTHPSVDRPGIAIGDPIASDLTPLAWPRDEGSLPEPPAPPDPPVPGWPGWSWSRVFGRS
jgi:ectoine hydroxylase-related dioxygenase (phytanoyl-CoA dioxygenase family)